MARMLESEEAARRLGIKLTTLYAYVSRGLLPSHPVDGSRRSLFDIEDVERLAKRSRSGRRVETRLASVTTGVTQIREDGPAYRNIPVATLAETSSYERVAELLWNSDFDEAGWQPIDLREQAPSYLSPSNTLRWAVLVSGAQDQLRSDLRAETVVKNARRIIPTCVGALARDEPASGKKGSSSQSIAGRLARSFVAEPTEAFISAIDTTLIVLADHELATSTMAVRVAACTRTDIYDALTAGLCVIAGPLHGAASELAHELLVLAQRSGVGPALDTTLRWQRVLPGFGHAVYRGGDPRFEVVMKTLEGIASKEQIELVHSLVEVAKAHAIPGPNIDLALATITWSCGLPSSAGQTIFSVARLAGWTAHYLEELNERPLRFRARAVYSSS
jgi:citrate synthase